ncbi:MULTISPECIES: PucR family transcriptional regulator ligand-binding domain-containing protein [Arthrobacter]|uniref:PucR family transcriptional regulator ligand-binding domain-containing protein n=2 Tax=Arthrobacter TaxID=1663 RepID=A0ABU9KP21_9MICC|nr:PucR family transcriptional regulator ligand-binding domain-containing protein [Arthrobacter sp. YJM1]MDP5228637.1 PucR family transcriptional regulator ligand-binding domain-containing protein [Arthrobacter sp. YJM1]
MPAPTPPSTLTVRDVLTLEALAAGRPEVLAGESGLDAPVRWVHIAEDTEAGGLLQGGELVLTTGLAFRRSPALTTAFLRRFHGAGAAAVVVELVDDDGAPDTEAIATLRAAAAVVDAPLVLLTRRVRFVQVTEDAHRALMAQQVTRLERARHVHEVFTGLGLENAGEAAIVQTTAELLGSPVVFEDAAHLVLSYATHGEDPTRLLDRWTNRSRHVGYLNHTGFGTGGERWLQTPVGLKGQRWGRLLVPGPAMQNDDAAWNPDSWELDTWELTDALQVLERAGQALTMARMAGRDRRELLIQARAGLVQDLRQASPPREEEARARARALGLEPGAGYVPVVAKLDGGAEGAEDATAVQLSERAFLDALQEWAARDHHSVLAASLHAGSVAILLLLPALELEDATLHRLAAGVHAPGLSWTLGVGRPDRSLVAAARGLDDADQVADTAATLASRRLPFHRFSDIRLRGLLSLLGQDPRVKAFAQAELAPLLDPPAPELIELLRDHLEHGGNMSSLARARKVSRQALYAQVRRLEERLGVSLDEAESRASLAVALLWHELAGR